jgi:hypothetical protein
MILYTFTIDSEGEETAIDLVKDFTAFMILIDIDNLVASIFISKIETKMDLDFYSLEEYYQLYLDV